MDLILTNRKYAFKSSSLHEIGVSDHHHHLIYTILKSTLSKSRKQNLSSLQEL